MFSPENNKDNIYINKNIVQKKKVKKWCTYIFKEEKKGRKKGSEVNKHQHKIKMS